MSVSSIYSHRPMLPANVRTNPAPASSLAQSPPSVLNALDTVRHECETLQTEVNNMRHQRNDLEAQLDSQLAELNNIRRAFADLEAQHARVRAYYEEELSRLRSQVNAARPDGDRGSAQFEPSHPIPRSPRSLGAPLSTVNYATLSAKPLKSPRDRLMGEKDNLAREPDRRRVLAEEREHERLADSRDAKRHKSRRDDDQDRSSAPAVAQPPGSPHPPTQDGSGAVSFAMSTIATHGQTKPHPKFAEAIERIRYTLETAPPEYRKEHSEWQAIYNSNVKKAVDINLVHTFVHSSVVCCVQFSFDGRYVAVGCNRVTYIYDVQSGGRISVLPDDSPRPPQDSYIRSVRFSPDGKLLATGAEDRKIKVWDIANRRIAYVFEGHESEIYSLDFSRDGRYIVSGSGDGTVRIWGLVDQTRRVIAPVSTIEDARGITSVAISPDSQLVVGGCLDRTVLIWDIKTGALLEQMQGHEDSVYSVAFTPDGKGVVSGSLDMTLRFWDISGVVRRFKDHGPIPWKADRGETVTSSLTFIGHRDFVLSTSVTTDSRWVVSGSKDRTLNLWDARTSELQFTLHGHKNSVISLAINPLGGMMVTGSGDSCARIWTYSAI